MVQLFNLSIHMYFVWSKDKYLLPPYYKYEPIKEITIKRTQLLFCMSVN